MSDDFEKKLENFKELHKQLMLDFGVYYNCYQHFINKLSYTNKDNVKRISRQISKTSKRISSLSLDLYRSSKERKRQAGFYKKKSKPNDGNKE